MPGLVQMVDTFAKPKMCLLVDVIQWFLDQKITYEPQSIYEDVQVDQRFLTGGPWTKSE